MDDKKKSASSEFDGMSGDKQKALSAALAQIEKQFGKGSIMRLGDAEINQDIQVVSSGSLGLDIALGVGGLARGVGPRGRRGLAARSGDDTREG